MDAGRARIALVRLAGAGAKLGQVALPTSVAQAPLGAQAIFQARDAFGLGWFKRMVAALGVQSRVARGTQVATLPAHDSAAGGARCSSAGTGALLVGAR